MNRVLAAMVCVTIPMLLSTVLQRVYHFSDYVMIAIYFVMFGGLFFIGRRRGWFNNK